MMLGMDRRHVCENNMKKECKGMTTALRGTRGTKAKGLFILNLPRFAPLHVAVATSRTETLQMQCNIENE
jgi:hypothetical protein